MTVILFCMNDEEIHQAKELLSKLEPGYLPEPLFHEFTRLSVSGILELVPIRRNQSNEIEVLVLERKADDPHWPGMLHTPGTILRPTDTDDFSSAIERVFKEINRNFEDHSVKNVATVFHTVNRGKELSVVFATEIKDSKESDTWIKLSAIDSHIVETQIEFVKKAVELFTI